MKEPRGDLWAFNFFFKHFATRLEELQVLDLQFLHGCSERPAVAVLYQDAKEARHVKTYEVGLRDKEFHDSTRWAPLPNVEASASMLIPVPGPAGTSHIILYSLYSCLSTHHSSIMILFVWSSNS